MADFVFEILKLIFGVILEMVLVATGEVVLFVLSFGRRKPRWDLYTRGNVGYSVLFGELSCWVGLLFWVATIVIIANL